MALNPQKERTGDASAPILESGDVEVVGFVHLLRVHGRWHARSSPRRVQTDHAEIGAQRMAHQLGLTFGYEPVRFTGRMNVGTLMTTVDASRLKRSCLICGSIVMTAGIGLAQQPLCIPGTGLCAGAVGNGGLQAGAMAKGRVGPNGAAATGNANANANANGSGHVAATGTGTDTNSGAAEHHTYYRHSEPIRFGAGLALCGTLKAGIYSGIKGGPCFAISFRTERLIFEMETQLLFGGVRHTIDWVFPMSFVIPLTDERSLYQGLHLRVGGSPIGVTFAHANDGPNYLRFGLHAGVDYEWSLSSALTWRVFDARTHLDFGTKREVDRRNNFLDFGGQLSTGIVF